MQKTIKHTIQYAHKPEMVWEYLTNAELLAQWLMQNDFKPVVGHEFQFRHTRLPDLGLDGIVYCRVLEIIPNKKLVYSWKAGPGDAKITLDSLVTFTLVEKNNGTELTLQHTGFTDEHNSFFALMDQGWLKNMQKINTELTN